MAKNYLTKCSISIASKEIPLVLWPMCVIFSTENTINFWWETKSKTCVVLKFSEALLINSRKEGVTQQTLGFLFGSLWFLGWVIPLNNVILIKCTHTHTLYIYIYLFVCIKNKIYNTIYSCMYIYNIQI